MNAASERRRLIVNADDFGLSPGVNRGVVEAHEHGIVTSTSLMVRGSAALEAARLARQLPSISVGLHVDVGEWRFLDGTWLPVYEHVPPDDAKALHQEVADQIARFRDLTGHDPSHLDSHQHAHLREPLRGILAAEAQSLGVPLRHVSPGLRYVGDFYGQDETGAPLHGRLEPAFLATLIHQLPRGLSELCCHPAAWVDFHSAYQHERVDEMRALCSGIAAEAVQSGDIELITFRDASPHRVEPR